MSTFRAGSLAIAAATLLLSQTNVGRISGTVFDSTGAVIAGCQVDSLNAQGQKESTRTDQRGFYVFPALSAGVYELRVDRPGFRSEIRSGVVLDASSERTIAFRLEVGQITDVLNVSASAQQVEAASGNVAKVINEEQVSQIALNGREYTQLLRLSSSRLTTSASSNNSRLRLFWRSTMWAMSHAISRSPAI